MLTPTLLLFCSLSATQAPNQDPQARAQVPLADTVVTASRHPEPRFEAKATVDRIDELELERRSYRTTPQILSGLPGIFVQETSPGQGSPYIRGFTGYRNLFLIDGFRLNNSVFRSGPNQYWNTVDPLSLESVEVVRGPASVLWGSDAIGGTVLATTKVPRAGGSAGAYAGELFTRLSTAEESWFVRQQSSAALGADTGLLLGVSGKTFGDVHGGHDIGRQNNTGYDEYDLDAKVEHWLDSETRLVVAAQHVQQNDVPRTHQTVAAVPFEGSSVGSDLRRDLDQERTLAYVKLERDGGRDSSDELGFSWQRQEESRDRVRGSGNREFQGFDVRTLGLIGRRTRPGPGGTWTFGFDLYHDDVSSFSSTNPIQGPVADDATYDLIGLYVQDELALSERVDLALGLRFSHARVDANDVDDPDGGGRLSIEDDWSSVAGSARVLVELVEDAWNLFGGISQGFRAPNLSDLTRFDTARTDEFEIAAPGLDPERTLNYELGVRGETGTTRTQCAVFYTDIEDQIVRVPTGNVNGAGDAEVTKDNVGDGYVYGIELAGARRLDESFEVFGNGTWQYGKVDTFPTSAPVIEREYIDRLMPLTLQAGLGWDDPTSSAWAELVGLWADDADKLSTRDAGDTSRIPPGGTPSYFVLDLRGGYDFECASLGIGLTNLLDEDYRVHGSGTNRPGRSLVVSWTGYF